MISLFIFGPVIVSHSTDPESMQNTVSPLSAHFEGSGYILYMNGFFLKSTSSLSGPDVKKASRLSAETHRCAQLT